MGKLTFQTKYQTIGTTLYEPESKLPSLTDESFKQECDIDFIISNFVQRGINPPEHQVQYGKQYTSDDFINGMNIVAECKSAFEELPAIEKERFNNSVSNFLEFIANPDNLRESYEKGYIDPTSVDIADVYPERFIKENTSVNNTNVSGSSSSTSNTDVLPGSQTGSDNPASS